MDLDTFQQQMTEILEELRGISGDIQEDFQDLEPLQQAGLHSLHPDSTLQAALVAIILYMAVHGELGLLLFVGIFFIITYLAYHFI
jgi:hypothetical protein